MSIELTFGERLGDLMKEKNINGKTLSEMTGIPTSNISDMLNGKRKNPTMKQIIKLSNCLEVSSDYLLGLVNVTTTNIDEKYICNRLGLSEIAISKIEKLNNDYKPFFIEYLNYILENDTLINLLNDAFHYVKSRMSSDEGYKAKSKEERENLHKEVSELREIINEKNLPVAILKDYEIESFYYHFLSIDISKMVLDIYTHKKSAHDKELK